MVPRTTVGRIADQSLISGDDAHTPSMRHRRATTLVPLVAYTCPIQPKGAWIDWTMYDPAVILIAHISEWTAQQATQFVSDFLKRPIVLADSEGS